MRAGPGRRFRTANLADYDCSSRYLVGTYGRTGVGRNPTTDVALLYKELTNRNYEELARDIQRWPEVSAAIGLDSIPDASTFSRTWRNRFPGELRDIVTSWVSKIREYAQRYDVPIQTVREEPTENNESESGESDEDTFSSQQITQMLKLGRSYAFAPFDSERADNSSYDDNCFLELQSYIGMVGCGADQGSRRFAAHSHREQTHTGTRIYEQSSSSTPTRFCRGSTRQPSRCSRQSIISRSRNR